MFAGKTAQGFLPGGRGNRMPFLLAGLLIGMVASAGAVGEWEPVGMLPLPKYNYSYLAATPNGDLLAATFNVDQQGAAAKRMPALLIRHPLGARPEVIELCSATFEAQRGYGGIACDAMGNFYISGDTGNPETCFVKKFLPDGSPDLRFGAQGELKPRRRCLGLDVVDSYLFLAVDWGQIGILDARTGAYLGAVPAAPGTVYLRDIAVDPASLRIYGVAAGTVVTWESGAPWNPGLYTFRALASAQGRVRAGEGITFDPVDMAALITPVPGNTLLRVWPDGRTWASRLNSPSPDAPLADICLSFDGATLFVSDFNLRGIHVMRRQEAALLASVSSAAAVAEPGGADVRPAPTTEQVTPVEWKRSYYEVLEDSRRQGKPMIVYFRRGDVKLCEEFEKNVLLTPTFNALAQPFTCVFEDVNSNTLLAYRFGVFRVPHIVILDGRGETAGRFTGTIDPAQLARQIQHTARTR